MNDDVHRLDYAKPKKRHTSPLSDFVSWCVAGVLFAVILGALAVMVLALLGAPR
jgi:hypothetical protein